MEHAPQSERDAWVRHWIVEGFTAFEAMLVEDLRPRRVLRRRHSEHRRLLPDPAGLQRPKASGVDLTPFPNIRQIEVACLARPELRCRPARTAAGRAPQRLSDPPDSRPPDSRRRPGFPIPGRRHSETGGGLSARTTSCRLRHRTVS